MDFLFDIITSIPVRIRFHTAETAQLIVATSSYRYAHTQRLRHNTTSLLTTKHAPWLPREHPKERVRLRQLDEQLYRLPHLLNPPIRIPRLPIMVIPVLGQTVKQSSGFRMKTSPPLLRVLLLHR